MLGTPRLAVQGAAPRIRPDAPGVRHGFVESAYTGDVLAFS
jgi:hypothetical protein